MTQEIDRFTLLTNIKWITIDGIRTYSHALLLSDDFTLGQRRLEVRGFGTEPAWPTFDFHAESLEYELVDTTPKNFIEDEGFHRNGHRIYTSCELCLKDGRTLKIAIENSEFPIDIQTFEAPIHSSLITEVWPVLWEKVERYWDAPGMPHLKWGPPGSAVDLLRFAKAHG